MGSATSKLHPFLFLLFMLRRLLVFAYSLSICCPPNSRVMILVNHQHTQWVIISSNQSSGSNNKEVICTYLQRSNGLLNPYCKICCSCASKHPVGGCNYKMVPHHLICTHRNVTDPDITSSGLAVAIRISRTWLIHWNDEMATVLDSCLCGHGSWIVIGGCPCGILILRSRHPTHPPLSYFWLSQARELGSSESLTYDFV